MISQKNQVGVQRLHMLIPWHLPGQQVEVVRGVAEFWMRFQWLQSITQAMESGQEYRKVSRHRDGLINRWLALNHSRAPC